MSVIASGYAAPSMQPAVAKKAAGFWRLAWKEYRTIRLFWLAIIALVVLIQWLTVTFSQEIQNTLDVIYNFALGAPAFFAVGCAGAMFAAEKEEGTIEFLRAAPVSAGQVLASKLMVVLLGTIAMLAFLWPLALLFSGNRFPATPIGLQGLLALWPTAALQAIAWGTLFSLLGARPLVAVVLAIIAATTCTHGLAWTMRDTTNNGIQWLSYWWAAPWSVLVALAVLLVDVRLGMRWLSGLGFMEAAGIAATRRAAQKRSRRQVWNSLVAGLEETQRKKLASLSLEERQSEFTRLIVQRSRTAMLGRLIWQHVRQSGWLMLLMAIVFVTLGGGFLPWLASGEVMRRGELGIPWTMAAVASLMGSMVFLADQSQHRYRFFVEHNVPPRYVWLTRNAAWIATLLIVSISVCYFWLQQSQVKFFLDFLLSADREQWTTFNYHGYVSLPPMGVGLAFVAVAYSAGQFMSMLVRSGVIAGFFGLLLSLVLCGWTLLMHTMQISFWWSVLPIPVVLLLASWLWAPHWISENKRWSARGKIAAVVLAPMLVLMIAVPIYRVHQVPLVSPGFDPAQFEQTIKANLAEGLPTIKMYRDASSLYLRHPVDFKGDSNPDDQAKALLEETRRPPDAKELEWLQQNDEALYLLLEASRRPVCEFLDPTSDKHMLLAVGEEHGLIALIVTSGRQLEAEGKFDDALDRYFAALKVDADFNALRNWSYWNLDGGKDGPSDANRIFFQITYWAAQQGQTQERIRKAISRLADLDAKMLRLDDIVKMDYLIGRRVLEGENEARQMFSNLSYGFASPDDILWSMLMPWENYRALRVLNLLTHATLSRLETIRSALIAQNEGRAVASHNYQVNGFLAPVNIWDWSYEFLNADQKGKPLYNFDWRQMERWLVTTVPNLHGVGVLGMQASREMVEFEARKRGTMLVLAIEAYRLEHGELPHSLDDLRVTYFRNFPVDPYSGLDFRYFAKGVPINSTDDVADQSEPSAFVVDEMAHNSSTWPPASLTSPGLWCSGPSLRVDWTQGEPEPLVENGIISDAAPSAAADSHVSRLLTYRYKNGYDVVPNYQVWGEGFWFPIPQGQK